MENDTVRLEIGDSLILVEVDGVKIEVRGEDAAAVRRQLARNVLHAVAALPERREMDRRRAEAERAALQFGGVMGAGQADYPQSAINARARW